MAALAPWEWHEVRLIVAGRVLMRLRWGCVCATCAWRGPWRPWLAYPGADARCAATGDLVETFMPELRCEKVMPGRVAP